MSIAQCALVFLLLDIFIVIMFMEIGKAKRKARVCFADMFCGASFVTFWASRCTHGLFLKCVWANRWHEKLLATISSFIFTS
jgi:hypothetical protein